MRAPTGARIAEDVEQPARATRPALPIAAIALGVGVAAIAGATAVAIGVGLGAPHLTKVGLLDRTTLSGIALVVVGLAATVDATIQLVRAVSRWVRPLVVLASVIVVAGACWTLGVAVAATNVPPTAVGDTTPAHRGLTYRDVMFPAADGVTLSGWYIPSENGAAVALLHGAGSTRSAVLDHAVVLAEHGYGVLLYDARGHGRSEGRAMDFGWFGDEDVAGAVAFLADQNDVDAARIGIVGMSMGGEQAIGAAASIPTIRAVVAEGATTRSVADKAWLSDIYGIRGAVSEWLAAIEYGWTDLLSSASPPISLRDAVSAAAPRPVLLITAGDVADEGHAAEYIAGGSSSTVSRWDVPGAGHTEGLRTSSVEWESTVVGFLDAALLEEPARASG